PQNSKVTYKIYIKNDNPAKNIILCSAPSGGGGIKLIGDGKTATDLKAVFLSPIINGYVSMENITAQYINQRYYGAGEDSIFACGILKLFNCKLNGSKIDGLLEGEYGSKFILENVTIISKSPKEYCMTVLNHQEVWINGGTFNKPVYARDYGQIWYKNVLTNPPVVESGYMGKVTLL
ncbi:hypothetical protein, partial [Neobacillus drentensis]|uniref:hypothetical protein n=1 Tax=Neobacillus drentensis TaxID=220684 RepID=UPI0030000C05